jgi:radical SAM superfamily enzyme YgiQ (UPF0313 family)
MRLYLINPSNPLVNIVKESIWNRYRVWKPLGLMILAGLTPPEWEVSIIDENLRETNYQTISRPDLVGITAFTSQANRAYDIATYFRNIGVPVVMGGIHATMCLSEALKYVDAVVTGEAEDVWLQVLKDVLSGSLKCRYDGGFTEINKIPIARHDILDDRYAFGSIQTTRGCPLNCTFCSVSAFNGLHYRQRPISHVIQEFKLIREKYVLVVDDNLIGTSKRHIERAKKLFAAMAEANLRKEWIAQATINFADDAELMDLAYKAGCRGIFIGFESATPDGLSELGKKFNCMNGRDFRAAVREIHKYNIMVMGSFIIGLDIDKQGIGRHIAKLACHYGVDNLNTLFLTPLPGTKLWNQMKTDGRIVFNNFPKDWEYYTLTYPVAKYKHLTMNKIIDEMLACDRYFYSLPRTLGRVWDSLWQKRSPLISFISSLSYRETIRLNIRTYDIFKNNTDMRQTKQDL